MSSKFIKFATILLNLYDLILQRKIEKLTILLN